MVTMMIRFVTAATAVLALATSAAAQDPTTTLPDAYKVELDNAYVKVVRVHYDAHAKLPEHTHPQGTTLYVYLSDADEVIFRHVGGNNTAVTRPPVKAGGLRIASGREEHHSVENASDTPSDFLRIVLNTDDGTIANLRQRLPPGQYPADKITTEEVFANKQLRITRIVVPPGQKALVEAKNAPVLRVAVSASSRTWRVPPENFLRWLDRGVTEEFAVTGDFPVDLIKVELLGKPK